MKETTVYTSDTKNNKVYSTTDKLYLAHASSPRATTIFVGANSAGNLDSGLGVNSKYWAGDFWLRTPYKATVYHYVMVTSNTNSFVHYTTPYETVKLDLRPAFELDASTILFASAALAATSDGALTLQDTDGNGAFTLRYLASDLGSASVSYDKSQVTPTKDVSITLKDAEIHKEDSSVSITTPSLDKDYDGIPVVEPAVVKTGSTKDVVFTWYQEDGSGWQTLTSAPSDAGSYKVVASVEGDGNHNGATSDELKFTIGQAANEWTQALSITGWTYGDSANAPTAAAKYGTVTFAYSDSETGTYTDTVPTNAGTWYVRATVAAGENYGALEAVKEFQIAKAGSTVAITTSSLDKKYDGIAVGNPAVEKTGSTKDVVFTWYQEDGSGWKDLVSAPADPGSYRVVASVEGDANYNGATSAGLAFFISRTANEWTQALSITGWTYGDPANAPTAAAKYGTVAFAYSNSETGPYTAAVPTNAGTWYVRATVAADVNYTGLETTKAFEIKKAIPAFVIPQNLTMRQGEALSTVSLPNGFAWKNAAQTADAFGTKQFKAIYTPADTENYQAVEVNIAVEVQKTQDTPADDARPPQTGDNSNIPLWVALLLLSGGVLGAVTYRKKKQSN